VGRQMLDGCQIGELDRLPGHDHSVRLVLGRRDRVEQVVRIGLEPRQLRRFDELGSRRIRGWAEIRRDDATWPALEGVETGVRGDAVEPGPEQGPALEGCASPPGAEQGLLDQVLGVLDRPQHPIAMDLELSPIALSQGDEGRLVAGAHRGHDCSLFTQGHSGDRGHPGTSREPCPPGPRIRHRTTT
jgi:hypothetical protein